MLRWPYSVHYHKESDLPTFTVPHIRYRRESNDCIERSIQNRRLNHINVTNFYFCHQCKTNHRKHISSADLGDIQSFRCTGNICIAVLIQKSIKQTHENGLRTKIENCRICGVFNLF